MPSKKKNKNKPKEGWVVELKEAEREVKRANQEVTPEQHLRVARAARKLRIWNKSKTAAERGLSIDPHGPLRAQLVECQKQADAELSIPSDVDTDEYKAIPDGARLDNFPTFHPIFSNLNMLQYATMTGDVRLLEASVAPTWRWRPGLLREDTTQTAQPCSATWRQASWLTVLFYW
jgi:hypothetical protein